MGGRRRKRPEDWDVDLDAPESPPEPLIGERIDDGFEMLEQAGDMDGSDDDEES